MYIRVMTGLESYKVAEQYNLMLSAGIYSERKGIPVADGFEPLQLNQTYVFFTGDLGGPYEAIVNPGQFAYSESRQLDSNFTYKEIKAFVESLVP